jgi:hypothetical protein
MGYLFKLIWYALTGLLRSRAALQTEILVLRHQLNVLRRRAPKRVAVRDIDRLVVAGLYRLASEVLDAVKTLKPETVIRWHRAGFRAWWRWKSRSRDGRPRTPDEVCQLIREMSVPNRLWGAPRIHGELLKLGIDVGQTTVAKYMVRRRRPPSQGGKTFPTITPTPSPRSSCSWCRQSRLGFGTDLSSCDTSRTSVAGRDSPSQRRMACRSADRGLRLGRASKLLDPRPRRAYGASFIRRVAAMDIRDRPTSARLRWQNGYAERLTGSIPRECLDHVVVCNHLSLHKDAPIWRDVCRTGRVLPLPVLADASPVCSSLSFRQGTGVSRQNMFARLRSDPADLCSRRETRPCVRAGPATAAENLYSVLKVGKFGKLIFFNK